MTSTKTEVMCKHTCALIMCYEDCQSKHNYNNLMQIPPYTICYFDAQITHARY